MKSLHEWKLERLAEYAPANVGQQARIDPNVLRLIQKVTAPIRAEYQDAEDAIEAIALSCIVVLNGLGKNDSIEKIKKAVDSGSPQGPLMQGMR